MENIYNFVQVAEIGTSGQPTQSQFSTLQDSGYQTIINLALKTSTNALENEKEIVEALGMNYIHIPVKWEHPKIEDLEDFFEAMSQEYKPIFVHCAANMRVSAFMYLYNRLQKQMSEEEAKAYLTQVWTPNKTWQDFIDFALATYKK